MTQTSTAHSPRLRPILPTGFQAGSWLPRRQGEGGPAASSPAERWWGRHGAQMPWKLSDPSATQGTH